MSTNFFESVYKYNDPVRYFKANDPYYFEVDNIPLKQLQENCNFLKDQISKLLTGGSTSSVATTSLGRDNFTELQPYVAGLDNKVKVKPGRYTARINDAYSIQPLQFLTQVAGFTPGEMKSFEYANQINSTYNSLVQKIRSTVASDALGMNGLLERTFIYSVRDISRKSAFLAVTGTCPGYTNVEENGQYKAYPNWTGELFNALSNPNEQASVISPYFGTITATGSTGEFRNLPKLETLFIKRWRGITRTAIVNVEEELEIEIPPFSDDDFFYFDQNNVRQSIAATQRIDLVFIYSKPIDTSSTTINKFTPQNSNGLCGVDNGIPTAPVKINKPVLGLVKGAGLGVNYHFIAGPGVPQPLNKSTTQLHGSDEHPMIVASVADSSGSNMGFGNIKGSFPSPDDLMNIAPLLTEDLEQTSPALIGQSILPVAYVVVRKNANVNENSNNILEIADLIDIRPFFRTTELAYNERAGLAAASPQVSLANPVATENYVDFVARTLDQKISQITGVNNQQSNTLSSLPRIIGAGYVMGGTAYGVEGTLRDLLFETNQNSTNVDVRSVFDYPSNIAINTRPDWDLASWLNDSDITGGTPGSTKYDWINYAISKVPDSFGITPGGFADNQFLNDNSVAYGPQSTQLRSSSASGTPIGFSTWPAHETASSNGGYYTLYYVSKTIKINRSLVPWMADYRVNVRLHNCVPLSSRILGTEGNDVRRYGQGASISNVWVSKKRVSQSDFEFTIFVGWTADDVFRQDGSTFILPKIARARSTIGSNNQRPINYNGFAVITKDMLAQRDINDAYPWGNGRPNTLSSNFNPSYYSTGGNKIGVALYPTVSFEVIGIPQNYNPGQNLNGANPYLTIVS